MKETNRKKKTMQETITKYQSKFDRLMRSIEKDKSLKKMLKKMPGNATAGIAVQMIKSLKSYLKANNKLKKEIKDLKNEAKPYIAYKKLILTAAKSEYDPKDVIDSLKFVYMHIKKKNWEMVDRVGGTSGDLMARGACPKCKINLVGKELRPRDFTLPCLIEGCTFNKSKTNKGEIL